MTATSANGKSLSTQLAMLYAPVADDLVAAEAVLRDEVRSHVDFVDQLIGRVELYRGKRLRPALLLLCGKACGKVAHDHHVLAAVVEMIHAATLVHDDVLDGASVRRHVSTVNAEWGAEASVLLGDFLFTHAFHLAASLESTYACRAIGRSTNRVCEGELHQIARRGAFELSEAEYLDILQGKTAELIECCARLGARFAGASESVQDELGSYGSNLGLAFQIADDLLDLVSDVDATGKSLGSDLANQKPTLPLIRFRQTASRADVARCREIFSACGTAQKSSMLELLSQSDALEYARDKARAYADAALANLDCLSPSPAKEVLESLTRFVVDRAG